jgi:hypothetical protein
MPKTFGGILGWVVGTLVVVAVGVAILSRTPMWTYIKPAGAG